MSCDDDYQVGTEEDRIDRIDQSLGTVTRAFLFTDIEGSTPLWERDAAEMATALARHDRLVADAIAAAGGSIVKHLGDGFVATFETPAKALTAAVALQRAVHAEPWPELTPLKVRTGLHLGEAESRGRDYFGRTVNLAARIMSSAAGGQLLVSATFVDALASLPHDVTIRHEGKCALKGIAEPVDLRTLIVEGLPLPASLLVPLSPRSNLPIVANKLVGRQDDVEVVANGLTQNRLVTLTGPPGTGKTRLAIEVAARSSPSFPLGTHFVELAPVSDAALVADQIADRVLGVSAIAEPGSALSRLATRLIEPALIVLDNCEHLLGAVGDSATQLLRMAPAVHILATSRERLFVSGEHPIAIEPLATDVAGPATQLFLQRARQARPSLRDVDDYALAEVCERLDGLPLAIELAAARLDVLSFEELAVRLDGVLQSRRRRRGFSDRHATLNAAVQWSWDLLDADEQLVLARASVFVGSFDLAAATTVCGSDEFEAMDIIDVIGSLQDRSFISPVFAETSNRFRLLEAVRAFAATHLDELETAITRRRHQNHFTATARQLATAFDEKPDLDLIAQLELDDPNFTAALQLNGDKAETRGARKLAMSLHTYWEETGRIPQGYGHASRLVEPHDRDSTLWRGVLGLMVTYGAMMGRLEEARDGEVLLGELIGSEPADIRSVNAYFALGFAGLARGSMTSAADWFDRAATAIAPFDGGGHRQALVTAGACLAYSGDTSSALERYAESRSAALPEPGWFEDYVTVFESSARLQSEPTQLTTDLCEIMEAALTSLVERGLGFRVTVAAHQAALSFALAGEWDRVDRWWPVALKMGRNNGYRWATGLAIELAAWSATHSGDHRGAEEHWTIVDTGFSGSGYGLPPTHQAIRTELRPRVTEQLGADAVREIAATHHDRDFSSWVESLL